ncbi:MAG: hypothetical protein EXS14_09105 [Planctomycetes bacterium]|nr:hypothetical protein [Planctomycetota bacterium]
MRRFKLALFVIATAAALLPAQLQLQPRNGDAIYGLSTAQLARFEAGRTVFNTPLLVNQGLGPCFNQQSCGGCHGIPAIGGAGTIEVTRYGITGVGAIPFNPMASLGGSLLQEQSTNPACLETVPATATVVINRLTNSTFGMGLVQAIPDAVLLFNALNPPAGVSGIAHMVGAFEDPVGAPLHVGRFGWKAQVATALTFSADASLMEMGMTNRFLLTENAPNGNLVLLAQWDTVPDPEDGPDAQGFHRIDRMADFQRFSAAPPQTPRSGMAGEVLFNTIGCASCHVASFTSGTVAEAALSNITIRPYSDFLLHDMGSLGDGIVQGAGTEFEMRTPSLWGMRARPALLHDGRATGLDFGGNVDLAVQDHFGEAAASRAAWIALSQAQKDVLVNFLDSLGRAEFDYDGDNDADMVDWFYMRIGFTGPVGNLTPEDANSRCDVDQDGDLDIVDFINLQRAFTGQ